MQQEEITQFVVGNLMRDPNSTSLAEDENLLANGIVDSLGIVKLIAFLEDRYDVRISDDEVLPENFESIAAISRFLAAKHN